MLAQEDVAQLLAQLQSRVQSCLGSQPANDEHTTQLPIHTQEATRVEVPVSRQPVVVQASSATDDELERQVFRLLFLFFPINSGPTRLQASAIVARYLRM